MKNRKQKINLLLLTVSVLSLHCLSCKDGSSVTEPSPTILTTETISKLNAAADKVMRSFPIPGMIACISAEGEGELLIARGVGNLSTNDPMSTGNNFRMASVTKTFTTETVLILVDEGKIDLNKTLSYYLPEYNIPGKDQITIRMLGTMRSGLIDCINDPDLNTAYFNSQGTIKFTPEQLIVPLLTSQLKFTPGSQFDYCNSNTILLGLIIKKVTGKEVKDVFQEKIFQPLGLTHTFWPETNYLPFPYHHAYEKLGGTLTDMTYYGNSIGYSAGILISNLADLTIWAKELSERKLLSANTKIERFQMGDNSTYSFGLDHMGDWVGHSGGIFGWNSMVYYNTVKKVSIVVHTNTLENTPAGEAFNEFGKIINQL